MTLDKSNSVASVVSAVSNAAPPVIIDYNISQITPYVFVAAEVTARQFPMIFSNGIGCVINVANELPQIVFPSQSGIESLKYPIEDTPTFPISRYFDIVADRIAANVASNRRTLLYCHHGRSRSVTFMLAYLIKHHRLPLPTAFALVKDKRQLALPNVGFWSQLQTYELQQQYKNGPTVLKNIQNSFSYGQQAINRVANGVGQAFVQGPIFNTFTSLTHPIYQKNIHPYHRNIRQRPLAYSRHYRSRNPSGISGIYYKPYF